MSFEKIESNTEVAQESGNQRAVSFEELKDALNQGDYGCVLRIANATSNFAEYSDTERENLKKFKSAALALLTLRIDNARRMYRADLLANPQATQEQKSSFIEKHLNLYAKVQNELSGANLQDSEIEPLVTLLNKPIDED